MRTFFTPGSASSRHSTRRQLPAVRERALLPAAQHDDGKYWRIDCPSADDYSHQFVNGGGSHPYGMPGVNCAQCGRIWAGMRPLPYPPPASMRRDKRLRSRWPIGEREHVALREEVRRGLAAEGRDLRLLKPVVDFQPLEVSFAAAPWTDFVWPSLCGPVVTDAIRGLFEAERVTGVAFCPVVIRKVGRHIPGGRVPIPRSGEPEDIIGEARPVRNPAAYGPLFEMVVTEETPHPPGVVVRARCEACGGVEYDRSERRMVLTPDMVPESDVFYLGTTLYVIVTARVARLILAHDLTNVAFEEMPLEQR